MKFQNMKVLFPLSLLAVASLACTKTKAPEPVLEEAPKGQAAAPMTQKQKEEVLKKAIEVALNTVYFEFDSAVLTQPARENLAQMAKAMKLNPGVKLSITGHSDERGSNEYNLALGERRANAIKEFLLAEGVNVDRLTIASRGEEEPAVEGSGEDVWAKNRRGQFARL